MFDTRRWFLKNLAGASGSFLLLQSSPPIPTPRRRTPVDPPEPAEKQDADNEQDPSASRGAQRARLLAQEKEFRETMKLLFSRVRDLQARVDALHTSDVFSVAIFKQTQEIEKLAKQLKNYAKV
jgi:hypothetical protein